MRSFAAGWCGLLVGSLFACSSSSRGDGAAGTSAGGSGVVAAGGASGGAGAGGASPASLGGAANLAGSSSEGNDVTGPLDTMSGAGAPGSTALDAGEPPVTQGVCPPGPFAANPVPAGAAAEVLCSDMTFTEGPVWFEERNTLFFSDFSIGEPDSNFNGPIMAFTPGGTCVAFIADAGTNGLAIAPDGNLLGCRHSDQTLTIFDLTTREPTVLVADNAGAAFNTTNDVAVRSDGNMYFTDPTYLLGNRDSEQPARAYRRDPSGVLSVIDQNGNTNGITLSPDETRLYLSHFGGGQNNVIVFDVDASGAVSNPQPFIGVGSDGMVVDCAGNLYITQGGVRVYDPDGELITTIAAPGAANVAFGGPERRTLFITAEDELLSIELAIPGLPY